LYQEIDEPRSPCGNDNDSDGADDCDSDSDVDDVPAEVCMGSCEIGLTPLLIPELLLLDIDIPSCDDPIVVIINDGDKDRVFFVGELLFLEAISVSSRSLVAFVFTFTFTFMFILVVLVSLLNVSVYPSRLRLGVLAAAFSLSSLSISIKS